MVSLSFDNLLRYEYVVYNLCDFLSALSFHVLDNFFESAHSTNGLTDWTISDCVFKFPQTFNRKNVEVSEYIIHRLDTVGPKDIPMIKNSEP